MKFIEITNEGGAVIEIPDYRFAYVLRVPMEPMYMLGLNGATMKVPSTVLPFDSLQKKLMESDEEFVLLPIPEGVDAIINPNQVLFLVPTEINKTDIMFNGGLKVIVAEGINTVKQKLSGQSSIVVGE